MQTLAPTGSIAVSEAARKLVRGIFPLKPLGPTRVKGVSEPVNVYEVTGLGPLRTRLQRCGGARAHEVRRTRARDGRRSACAGTGARQGTVRSSRRWRSRESASRACSSSSRRRSQSGWMVLEAFSVSHGKATAYLPVIDLLHGYFEIDRRGRRAQAAREGHRARLSTLDRALEDTLPYLFGLLGIVEGDDPLAQMDAQVKKRRTLEAIKRILLRESLNQPLMVIFEDLHWIDEQTQALLNLLADSIGTAQILLLVNYRPEYSHQWGSKTYYTQLRLDPLGKESAEEMLAALLGDGNELAAAQAADHREDRGQPFFMEEMVQVLFDEGALVRNGTVKLTKPLAS